MNSFRKVNRMALSEARTHAQFFVVLNIILGTAFILQVAKLLSGGYDFVSGAALFLFAIGGALAPTCVISVFRELHNQQQSDVVFALPMSAKERYASRILAVFYLHLLPVIVWSGVIAAVTAVVTHSRSTSGRVWLIEYTPSPRALLQMFLLYVMAVLFFEAVSVICAVCCGRRAEMRYFTYIAAISISVAPLLIRSRLMEEMGGQVTKPSVLFYLWSFSALIEYLETSIPVWELILLPVASILISLGVIALMFALYRRRDAETAGKPVVSRVFFELVMLAGVVTFYSLFLFEGSPEAVVAIAGIVYLVIHLVTFREVLSGKKVVWWFAKFVATTVLFLGLVFAAYMTDGFGAINYMPARNLDGADIIVSWEDPDRTSDGFDSRITAYAGTDSYLQGASNEWVNIYDYRPKKITDAQIRKIVATCRKYAKKEKSLKEFYDRLWGTDRFYSYLWDWNRGERVEIILWLPGKTDEPVMEQVLWLSEGNVSDFYKELENSGLMNISRAWR